MIAQERTVGAMRGSPNARVHRLSARIAHRVGSCGGNASA